MAALLQTRGRNWIQESYETGDPDIKRRAKQLRALGYRVLSSSLGSQVTQYGRVKMTLLDIRPGTTGDEYLEQVNPRRRSRRNAIRRGSETYNALQLINAGYTIHSRLRGGRWFEVTTPGGQAAVVGVQNPKAWHVFGKSRWTTSGSSAERAERGGLGDVIGTDAEMRGYKRFVLGAPRNLAGNYDGLYEAQGQVRNPARVVHLKRFTGTMLQRKNGSVEFFKRGRR